MTSREITSLALKVFAIYVLVQAVLAIPVLVGALFRSLNSSPGGLGPVWMWALGAFAILALGALCLVLWRLANKTIDIPADRIQEERTGLIDESFVLAVLGFYFAFEGLIRTALLLIGRYGALSANSHGVTGAIKAQTIAYLACYCVQIVVGLTLILRPNGWAALLRRLRHAGLKSKPPV